MIKNEEKHLKEKHCLLPKIVCSVAIYAMVA